MASSTQTIQRPFVKPSRNYDYLYGKILSINLIYIFIRYTTDPIFTVSSHKDHSKESYKAQTTSDKLVSPTNMK